MGGNKDGDNDSKEASTISNNNNNNNKNKSKKPSTVSRAEGRNTIKTLLKYGRSLSNAGVSGREKKELEQSDITNKERRMTEVSLIEKPIDEKVLLEEQYNNLINLLQAHQKQGSKSLAGDKEIGMASAELIKSLAKLYKNGESLPRDIINQDKLIRIYNESTSTMVGRDTLAKISCL
ncbi:MAG: hypothetical protein EPO11_01200, partial [Gammaproteobacteria bacterium]